MCVALCGSPRTDPCVLLCAAVPGLSIVCCFVLQDCPMCVARFGSPVTVPCVLICAAVTGPPLIVQELCESRGGRPGLSVLTSLPVSVDVKLY